ncbi:MAG: fibronectin type III domain-containing protein [Actinomycetota bacterium]|nr:fibronectin type III domain-containing protein [Actinomycetota bacterium]
MGSSIGAAVVVTGVMTLGLTGITSAGASTGSPYNWTPRHVATVPAQRTSAAMAYDATSASDRVVVFGGFSQGADLATTWTWNGTAWNEQHPVTSPSARTGAAMAYDATSNQVVLFGGTASTTITGTTWLWNGSTWVQPSLTGAQPPARTLASMAYDPELDGLVMFGGTSSSSSLSTVWLWKNTAWTTITPAAATQRPLARSTAPMSYDTATGQLVLFGGYDGGPIGTTWVLTGQTWTKEPFATGPAASFGATSAYDTVEGELLLFGGSNGSTTSTSTWEWTGTGWTALSPSTHPPAQAGGSMAYDAATGEVVLLNGVTAHPTWTWQSTSKLSVPGAPGNVTALAGTSSAKVTWTAPSTDGGTTVTGYTVTSSPGTLTCTVTAPTRTCTLAGLTNATTYSFTVKATNGVGSGPSARSNAVVPSGLPFAPTGVTATAGTLSATVTWKPATGNGAAVTSYSVTSSPGTFHCTTATLSCKVTTLSDNVPYQFRVVAKNKNGTSTASTPSSTLTLAGVPFAPTGVSAARANQAATIAWTAATTNGAPVTSYTVTGTPGSHGCSTTGAVRTCTVTGLTNGVTYTFTVRAANRAGSGLASTQVSTVPASVPFAPTGVTVARGSHQVLVTWKAATPNGTSISAYTVTSSPGTKTCSTTGALTCTVTGLTNGVHYSFRVVATNGVGRGTASTPSSTVVPATVPGPPTDVQAERGDQQVRVSWLAPTSGGTPVSGYTVTSTPGGQTCTTTGTSSCTVLGLTNGVGYTFQVTAANGVGTGTPSTRSTAAVPAGKPFAPTGVSAVRGDHTVTVSWHAATGNGAPVTGYSVVSTPAGGTCRTTSALTCTVAGLVNGTTYAFTVTATNDVGTGTASAASSGAVPAGAPFPPSSLTAVVGPTSVMLKWSAATSNGAQVSAYEVLRGPAGGALQVLAIVTGTSFVDSSAVPGTAYSYEIEAQNVVGTSVPTTARTAEVDPPGQIGERMAATPDGQGYWLVAANGAVSSFGRAGTFGSLPGLGVSVDDIVGIASTDDGQGYWMVGADGGIFAFGDAAFYGSMGGKPLNEPIVAMEATPDGKGYWMVASDGGIFAFGDAAFYGSTGDIHLNEPVVGMAVTPDGQGYWLVASDGGIFSFGDAAFYGSTGDIHLNKPIVAMGPTHTGGGYWLVASDGGIFAFGDAPFYGSTGGSPPPAQVVGLVSMPTGGGYTEIDAQGTSFPFPVG